MKKLFVSFVVGIAFVASLCLGSANAMPIMIDVGAAISGYNYGDGDDYTGLFDQLGLYIQTTSTPTGETTFLDVGDVHVTSLLASTIIDTEGLNTEGGWELTGRWDNLTGIVSHDSGVDNYTYTSGTLNLYADAKVNHNFGDSIGSYDDSGFIDGTLVATAELTGGEGHIVYKGGTPVSGDTLTYWQFTYMLEGFWLDQYGSDLSPYVSSTPGFYVVTRVDANTHQISIDDYGINSTHDGSASIDVVPEPVTMLLLGTGLIGFSGLGRRKFMKKG